MLPRLREYVNSQGKKVSLVARDQGPASYRERTAEAAAYNGETGGRVFKWYRKSVFQRHLLQQGAEVETCSERQCMDALRATSTELERDAGGCDRGNAYAGPQCFPQLAERMDSNEELRGVDDAGNGPSAMQREEDLMRTKMRDCWKQCAACQKWRLLDPDCMKLWDEEYYGGLEEQANWKCWLSRAPARYASFLRSRRSRRGVVEESASLSGEGDRRLGEHAGASARQFAKDAAFSGWLARGGGGQSDRGAEPIDSEEGSQASDNSAAADLELSLIHI